MRSFCCCLVLLVMLPASAQEVWRGLRWDMPMERAEQTLTAQGLKVREQQPRKTAATHFSTDVDGWHATVYFDPDGRMNQITLIADKLTKEAAAAVNDRLTKRFGEAKSTTTRSALTWGERQSAKEPWMELMVVRLDDGWLAREEYGRGDADDPVGVFGLTWGQAPADVEEHLRAAGFEADMKGPHHDPCTMPNAPDLCAEESNATVGFRTGSDGGTAIVNRMHGLAQITFNVRVASQADGLARAKAIEAVRGPATEVEDATITTWGNATSNVSLDLRLTKPAGTLSAIENYSPADR
jgi:hypothetical protein